MGSAKSKAKRKAELAKRARQLQQRKGVAPHSSGAADQTQAAWNLKPEAFPGEAVHDVAVFARSSRSELPEELQTQAAAVAESLEQLRQGDDRQALELVKEIPRSSPYADWRLLIRGLVYFYQNDLSAAQEAWRRLDPHRRPGRIAAALSRAETDRVLFPNHQGPPGKLVQAAQHLRQRPHILAAARRIADVKHSNRAVRFSVPQAKELIAFRNNYRSFDPVLVDQFTQACVVLATRQNGYDVFELLRRQIPGPPHDPHWHLETFKYNLSFDGAEEETKQAADSYVERDLPSIALPQTVKSAVASLVRLIQARDLEETEASVGPFAELWRNRADSRKIEKLYEQAIEFYAGNRQAHLCLLSFLEEQLEDRGCSAADKKKITKRLVACKTALVQAFPEEVEATLWLIDHYVDEQRLSEANQLVEQLSSYRLNDPRAKALRWKLKTRDAMHHSRRKQSLQDAWAALDAAQEIWPGWLDQTWLPFLRAALKLRQGDRQQFEQMLASANSSSGVSPVVGQLMSFAALQSMNIPSAELKPFRQIVDQHLTRADSLSSPELLAIGSFWWDLTRGGLRHGAYRTQAPKIGKALLKRLKNFDKSLMQHPGFEGSMWWLASHGFWSTNGAAYLDWLHPYFIASPKVAAAAVDSCLRNRYYTYRILELLPYIEPIREAAAKESDAFYRYTLNQVILSADEQIAQLQKESGFGRAFPSFMLDDDDDDECDCEECQARRAAEARHGSTY